MRTVLAEKPENGTRYGGPKRQQSAVASRARGMVLQPIETIFLEPQFGGRGKLRGSRGGLLGRWRLSDRAHAISPKYTIVSPREASALLKGRTDIVIMETPRF